MEKIAKNETKLTGDNVLVAQSYVVYFGFDDDVVFLLFTTVK